MPFLNSHATPVPTYEGGNMGAVTEAFLQQFCRSWEDAWNSHDTDQVLQLLHPDIRWNDTIFWPEMIYGAESMRAYIDKIWKVMPDVNFREVQFFRAPESGRAMYLFEQSASAPPSTGLQTTAKTYGCDIFLGFKDDLLIDYMAQYEVSEMMRQFQLLPPRTSQIGGGYLMKLLHNPQI